MPNPNTNVNVGVGNVDIVLAIQNLKVASTSSVTISSGSTVSTQFNLDGNLLCGFVIPSGYDGGNITIQASDADGGTFYDIYDSNGTAVIVTIGGDNRIVNLVGNSLQAVASAPYIKLKSASTVGANRTIKVLAKG